jgi:hypothetical protein
MVLNDHAQEHKPIGYAVAIGIFAHPSTTFDNPTFQIKKG